MQRPEGGEAEIWFPRAAVQPLAGGQWLISRAALEAKEEAAAEVSKADAVFGKDFLPVLYGRIIEATEKAYKVVLMVSWGSSSPQPWRGYVPITQARVAGGRLCLSRWIIGQKQDELFSRGMPGPQGGGGRHIPDEFKPRPIIEIDQDALAAAIRGPEPMPDERPTAGPATPAKPNPEPGRLF